MACVCNPWPIYQKMCIRLGAPCGCSSKKPCTRRGSSLLSSSSTFVRAQAPKEIFIHIYILGHSKGSTAKSLLVIRATFRIVSVIEANSW